MTKKYKKNLTESEKDELVSDIIDALLMAAKKWDSSKEMKLSLVSGLLAIAVSRFGDTDIPVDGDSVSMTIEPDGIPKLDIIIKIRTHTDNPFGLN